MKTIWLFVCRLAVYVFLRAHLYRLKSYIVNAFWEPRECRDVELLTFRNWSSITDFMGHGAKWRADGWKSLWDAVHTPQYAQQAFSGVYAVESDLDCDDHARFAVAAISHSIAEEEWRPLYGDPKMLSVGWIAGMRPAGHMVAVVTNPAGQYFWGDYGALIGPFASLSDVARNVRSVYAPGSDAIGHSTHDEDLRPLEVHWGE